MNAEHVLFLGWNHPIPGREMQASELFTQFMGYLTNQMKTGMIESFEPVLLGAHGGDMNGFFIVRGDYDKLTKMQNTDDFMNIVTDINVALSGFGLVRGWAGNGITTQMNRWKNVVTKYQK